MRTTSARIAFGLGIVAALIGAAASVLASAEPRTADDHALARRRAERRAAVRARALDKEAGPASFGLLVIPVDFADARFPDRSDPVSDLGPRLSGGDRSLATYFTAASRGRTALHVVLAPVVHLAGTRRDYSDLGYTGHEYPRTRALGEQAIAGAAAAGVPFGLADRDGPDGLPGDADDDGYVDGVLILHAAPGLENDPTDGLVVPLQFFLEEPYPLRRHARAGIRGGRGAQRARRLGARDRPPVRARRPLRSVPGVGRRVVRVARRPGRLQPDGRRRVGQRRRERSRPARRREFAAARVGRRAGPWPAAAPVRQRLAPGVVWHVSAGSANPGESFLIETRGGTPPWDPALPDPEVLVYHVDAAVPDDAVSTGNGPEHLRVRLVEADGTQDLAAGISNGDLGDVFPGSTDNRDWGPATTPSSAGYHGASGAAFALEPVDRRVLRGPAGAGTPLVGRVRRRPRTRAIRRSRSSSSTLTGIPRRSGSR